MVSPSLLSCRGKVRRRWSQPARCLAPLSRRIRVACSRQGRAGSGHDDVGAVVLEVERDHTLLDAHWLEHEVESLQLCDGEFFVFTFLADLEQFVDVAAGANDVDVGVELGIALQIRLHRFPGFRRDAVREQTQRTYIIGMAIGECTIVYE